MESLYNFFIDLINALIRGLGEILSVLFAFLPNSPFQNFLKNDAISSYIGYINYFIPVGQMVTILTLWCTAIGIVYIVQIALRWIKAME